LAIALALSGNFSRFQWAHHVFGLAADPAAHIHVAVGRAGPRGIHVQADAGLAFLAVAAAPAGDVERYRNNVSDVQILDVTSFFNDFAGDLVPENQAGRRGGAPANHMLIAAAYVRGNNF